MSPYLSRPIRSLAEVLRQREKRIVFVPCEACEGKGGWDDHLDEYTDRGTGAVSYAWVDCPYCLGAGGEEQEVEVLPITQEDLPR